MIQMARWPAKPRQNAICEPSGDHAGSSMFLVMEVSVRPAPLAPSITPICTGPAESSEKEMRALSGDHEGYSANERVRRCGLEPSVAMLQRFSAPDRVEAKAMLVPSGDQAGDQSLALLRVRLAACEPSAFITQISSSRLMPCLESRYAIRRPASGPGVASRSRSRLRDAWLIVWPGSDAAALRELSLRGPSERAGPAL